MTRITKVSVVLCLTSTQAAPRPELPQCACLQTWPRSDNVTMWGKSFGDTSANGWALLATNAVGCTQVSSYWPAGWGVAADAYQFCVPDTTNGPCIGLGDYDPYSMSFYMFCGQQGGGVPADATAATPALTADQKLAAMAYVDAIAIATQLPACSCEDDWSASKLAETYCGSEAALAKGAVDSTTCANAPMTFDNSLTNASKGNFNYGYYRADQTPAQVYAVAKWCKVPLKGCAAAIGGMDACTDERWMATHTVNLTSMNAVEVLVAGPMGALEYTYGVNGVASQRSRQVLAKTSTLANDATGKVPVGGGTLAVAMTFFPENVNSYIGNTENLMLQAQAAAKATMDNYDKINWVDDHIEPCDAACVTQRDADALAAKNVSDTAKAQKFTACNDNAMCKEKQDFWLNCYKTPAPTPVPTQAPPTNVTNVTNVTNSTPAPAPAPSPPGVASGASGMNAMAELAGIVVSVAASFIF